MAVEGFLKTVLAETTREVACSRARIPLTAIRRNAEQAPPGADFLSALGSSSREDIGIIAEIKKASPSKGDIRPDLDVNAYARYYTNAGARAISVLTEPVYFKGTLQDLRQVCAATHIPVLRKDFTVSEYQIYEAKACGASAILLITTALSKDQLKDYIHLTWETGMEPLIEITSEKEFEIAYDCGAKVIDINNRNLETLKTDLNVSKRIAAILPDEIIAVEASGISGFTDIQNGLSSGFVNFLVGESIVRADDPESFIRHLRQADPEEA